MIPAGLASTLPRPDMSLNKAGSADSAESLFSPFSVRLRLRIKLAFGMNAMCPSQRHPSAPSRAFAELLPMG
jgi:hypothetical protein